MNLINKIPPFQPSQHMFLPTTGQYLPLYAPSMHSLQAITVFSIPSHPPGKIRERECVCERERERESSMDTNPNYSDKNSQIQGCQKAPFKLLCYLIRQAAKKTLLIHGSSLRKWSFSYKTAWLYHKTLDYTSPFSRVSKFNVFNTTADVLGRCCKTSL
jgi:hypothetical protein